MGSSLPPMPPTPPWRNWFHCLGSTYGTWLRGDPRGWRSRHHREHVEGDYKNPPPAGQHDDLLRQSKSLMKGDPVALNPDQRHMVCLALAEALLFHEVELVDLCVSATHYHVLARFEPFTAPAPSPRPPRRGPPPPTTNRQPRHIMGLAKSWAASKLVRAGRFPHEKVWAKRGKELPIENRAHQLWVVKYIRDHAAKEGASVWSSIR